MRAEIASTQQRRPWGRKGFTLAELLVVVGVITLLLAILTPSLTVAHRQAEQTKCQANLAQIAVALAIARNDLDFYPLWDDGGSPVRYTFIDVLIQMEWLRNPKGGYCPADGRPDSINMARGRFFGVRYPGNPSIHGIDYSYGIGVPLSAAGWLWKPKPGGEKSEAGRSRLFKDHGSHTAARVLAADATWSTVYNLSGDVLTGGVWNMPTQFDNTVAWWRHPGGKANFLLQDGHVESIAYQIGAEEPVNTNQHFLWHPGEPLNVGPDYQYDGHWYPNEPPVDLTNPSAYGAIPAYLIPGYYTQQGKWTQIMHK